VASQQVETMVKAKMSKPEYTILCLEDNSDWTNATTRRLVMAVRFFHCIAVEILLTASDPSHNRERAGSMMLPQKPLHMQPTSYPHVSVDY
jgi:hypothetical protein